jgi:hypothetical protein
VEDGSVNNVDLSSTVVGTNSDADASSKAERAGRILTKSLINATGGNLPDDVAAGTATVADGPPDAAQGRPVSGVAAAFLRLDACVAALGRRRQALTERLDPVLLHGKDGQTKVSSEGNTGGAQKPSSTVASQINQLCDRLDVESISLASLTEDVDL